MNKTTSADNCSAHLTTVTPTLIDPDTEALWTVEQTAAYLGIPVATIYAWRSRQRGPRGYRVGRHLRYRRAEVLAWLDEHAA